VGGANSLEQVFLALAVVVIASRAVGAVFKRLHQPPVLGEVLAGILLGPSLLGNLAPEVMHSIFPSAVLPSLTTISQVGIVIFMFLVGLELDVSSVRDRKRTVLGVSTAGILAPFTLGLGLAYSLLAKLAPPGVPLTSFALFMGVAFSITAFPVLARILTDRELQKTNLGSIALTCAAAGDAAAWCMLAIVIGVVNSRLGGAVLTSILAVAYVGVMALLVRPLLRRFIDNFERSPHREQQLMAVVFVTLLLSCVATEAIGIHALFGAFVLGAVIPHDSWVAETFHDKLYHFVVVILLPAFFALTGLRTEIGLIEGAQWLTCGLIVLAAFAGKFGSATLASRATGQSWRDSAALGILMNTRGLMELIVLNIGLELGVITSTLFAMMVIMALVTTFAAAPILDFILRADTAPVHAAE